MNYSNHLLEQLLREWFGSHVPNAQAFYNTPFSIILSKGLREREITCLVAKPVLCVLSSVKIESNPEKLEPHAKIFFPANIEVDIFPGYIQSSEYARVQCRVTIKKFWFLKHVTWGDLVPATLA